MSKKHPIYNKNGESTSSVSKVSYGIETLLVDGASADDIQIYITSLYKDENFPPNLQYIDSYYDEGGTCGVAFLDTTTGKVVLGYAGTHMDADGMKDVLIDAGIILGNTGHSAPAVDFYNEIAKVGYPITLTGHSLGGNIAVLVALITNNPTTVTYNGAPLSVSNGIEIFLNFLNAGFPEQLTAEIMMQILSSENKEFLEELMKNFDGDITRFVSEKDELNGISDVFEGVYIGNEYRIYNKNTHSIDFFLEEDMQTYLTKILDLEQQKTIYEDVGVDVDGDGKLDVIRSGRQLVVKNLLGTPGANAGGSGGKIQINPESLLNLSVNIQGMARDDMVWVNQNITQCESKNESITGSFETRKEQLNQAVVDGLNGSGLGTLLAGINDSFGKIKDKKSTLKTVADFDAYSITRKFDYLGESGKRKWFKGGDEWTFPDVSDFGKQLKQLMSASSILIHNIETNGEFNYTTNDGSTKIYQYDTISDISKAIVGITNGLEPKIKKVFKGLGLRKGNNDGISQSLTEVFEIEHQNASELAKALSTISALSTSIAINYQEKDKWIAESIKNGESSSAPNVLNVPKTYEAFLKETQIFDDVKDVLQAFDKQVEKQSQDLSKIIGTSYTDILDRLEAKTKVVSEGMNELKNMINALSKEMDKEITYEDETMKLVTLPVDTSKTASPGPIAPINKWEKETKRGSAGVLSSHFPGDVQVAIKDLKDNVLPLLDVFNAVLTASQMFNNEVNTMENYLKSVVEKAVYTALDLDEIVKVQMLSGEVIQRMMSELTNLDDRLKFGNIGLAIKSLSSQVGAVKKLLGYFNELIQNCFGQQIGGSKSSSSKGQKENSYTGSF
ncbi:SA1320 family protein [Carnobacterium gallinarum]|uniref:SA1320 family protein n=1 Tax=Carnobacterium gallinarum TaxID=2749 RepID=UPI0005566A55|nr:hypothetical protein [Carnobacterium gallinarum]